MTVKNYKTKSRTEFGETITTVFDRRGNFVGQVFKTWTEPGNPWKWVVQIGSDFLETPYGLSRSYTVRTKAEALEELSGVIAS